MTVERILNEMHIDWIGNQPELLMNPETYEIQKVRFFVTTLGISSLIYAEAFQDENCSALLQELHMHLNFMAES